MVVPPEDTGLKTILVRAIEAGDTEKVDQLLSAHPELIWSADVSAPHTPGEPHTAVTISGGNVLDLCVEHRQHGILALVLRRGLASSRDSLEQFLVKTEFCHAAAILPELVRLDTKSSLLLLNHWVTATAGHADEDRRHLVGLNFKHLGEKVTETILCEGCQEVSEHPLIRSYVSVKWTTHKMVALLIFLTNLVYALSLSAGVIVQNYKSNTSLSSTLLIIISTILHVPILAVNLILITNTNRALLPKIKIMIYIFHLLLFITYCICSLCHVQDISITHLTCWMITSTWVMILGHFHDLPCTSFYVEMFINVLIEVSKFIILLLSLLAGFSLSVHTILSASTTGGGHTAAPHNSLLKLLSYISGDMDFDGNFLDDIVQVHGTVQIIFLALFFIFNIVMINIMIGLTITSMHGTLQARAQLRWVRLLLATDRVDKLLGAWRRGLRRLGLARRRCCWTMMEAASPKEIMINSQAEAEQGTRSLLSKVSSSGQGEPGPSSRVPVLVRNSVTDEILHTQHQLPKYILEDCLEILEAKRLRYEEELAEAEKCQGTFLLCNIHHLLNLCSEDAEGYTSLYGDSDNQYEEIQTETKFEGLRSIKELLLRVRIVSR